MIAEREKVQEERELDGMVMGHITESKGKQR